MTKFQNFQEVIIALKMDGYGRVAIVTGAAQGIGLAIARQLLHEGKKVVFVDVNRDQLREIENHLEDSERARTLFIPADVSNVEAINDVVKMVQEKWNRIDILINNAGIRKETSIEDIDIGEWNQVMSINLGGTFFFSKAVLKMMKEQQWGRIVNLSSFGGQNGPLTSGAHYCASKAGQLVLTKVFARSLAGDGITVNTVSPAAIRTPEMDKIEPTKLQKMTESIPVGRVGEVDEVAQLVSFVVSEAAGYVTGATFDINGGLLMR